MLHPPLPGKALELLAWVTAELERQLVVVPSEAGATATPLLAVVLQAFAVERRKSCVDTTQGVMSQPPFGPQPEWTDLRRSLSLGLRVPC